MLHLREIGKQIRQARIARGFTITRLATEAGIHENTLAALERGKDHNFGLNTITAVMGRLGLDLSIIPVSVAPAHDPFSADWKDKRTVRRAQGRVSCSGG
ncbi:MAG: helix-turn-helix domain-containing protein [Acidiferrobacteraceae bacterium]